LKAICAPQYLFSINQRASQHYCRCPKRFVKLADNGSPYSARDTRSFAREIGLEPLTTAIRSPQSNGMAEVFVKTFKRDYVQRMDRYDAITVMRQLSDSLEHYNDVHPHSALRMLSPRMFRRRNIQLSVTACPEK